MDEKLLQQAINLFDTPEKWEAFCELHNNFNNMKMRNFRAMRDNLYSEELALQDPNWQVVKWNDWDIRWELKTKGKRLWIQFWGDYFRIYVGNLDVQKVEKLLEDDRRFDKIREAFSKSCRLDDYNNNVLAQEKQTDIIYTFNNKQITIKNSDELSWYVGHYPSEFKEQLIKKVRAMQSPEIVELFREIVEKCQ